MELEIIIIKKMDDLTLNKKVIAKNTLMLYFRMLLTMAVGVYTSRVVLQTLGVEDFGVYNVVGGFVAMLSYLNSVFVNSTQRFLSFTLGEGDKEKSKLTFSTAVSVHIAIALIVIIAAETFGLWFVNNVMNIEADRLTAANWVYQSSIFSLVLTIISVPNKSSIVAHEHMHIYAYVSVVEAFLKLGIVFLLPIMPADKLITYSILQLIVHAVFPIWFFIYCHRFEECRLTLKFEKKLFKDMLSFSGWVMIGDLGFSFKDQISNIIMNLFLGTAINAARGIATQVNALISSFAHNFTMALSPQITKQYAMGNYDQSRELVLQGARLSFYLMSVMSIPLLINIDYILDLWLGVVPEYASQFVFIIIIASIIHATSKTQTASLQATGDIKWFQIGVSLILLSELPIAYYMLYLGYSPVYALLPSLVTNTIAFIYRVYLLNKKDSLFSIKDYFLGVLIKGLVIMISVYLLCLFINRFFYITFCSFLGLSVLYVLISLLAVYSFGINRHERKIIRNVIKNKIIKK